MIKISAVTFTPIVTSYGSWTGEVLAVRCAKRGNHLEFPGGKVEPEDITLYDTAARELKEETGIQFRQNLLKYLWTGKTCCLQLPAESWYEVHCFLTPAIQADRVKKHANDYPIEVTSGSVLLTHPQFAYWYRQIFDVISSYRGFNLI